MSVYGTLFGRQYQLGIGTRVRPNLALYGNIPSITGVRATPLRVQFDVEKGSVSSPNKATIRITNMATQSASTLTIGMTATLIAGYQAQLGRLFVGGVAKVKTSREGPDKVTEMELGDAESAIIDTVFDKSYKGGTTLAQILSDLAQAFAAVQPFNPDGQSTGIMLGIPIVVYAKGYTAHGSARLTMQSLCQANGLEWSMQNGALQIVPLRAHTGETAELLSRQTGLIGVPSFDGKVLHATALLNPRLAIGRLVKVESASVNGFFKMRSGKWQGDSHGDAWTVEIEASPMPNIAQSLLPSHGLPLVGS